MPTNIEIKAQASDWDAQLHKAQALASSREELVQEDIFFNCLQGRLKLRMLGDGKACLIFYRRPDVAGPKASEYEIIPVADSRAMLKVFSSAMGEFCRVYKRRTVFHCGQTRIHFDDVKGLGHFIELEVVLDVSQTQTEGQAIAQDLMAQLGIQSTDLIESAYADLLLALSTRSMTGK
ncbi:MAG: class IV adenylate cyclase [Elusimicrobiota bacterium]